MSPPRNQKSTHFSSFPSSYFNSHRALAKRCRVQPDIETTSTSQGFIAMNHHWETAPNEIIAEMSHGAPQSHRYGKQACCVSNVTALVLLIWDKKSRACLHMAANRQLISTQYAPMLPDHGNNMGQETGHFLANTRLEMNRIKRAFEENPSTAVLPPLAVTNQNQPRAPFVSNYTHYYQEADSLLASTLICLPSLMRNRRPARRLHPHYFCRLSRPAVLLPDRGHVHVPCASGIQDVLVLESWVAMTKSAKFRATTEIFRLPSRVTGKLLH